MTFSGAKPFVRLASKTFRNRYFALRHGRSVANEEGIIVSDPHTGASAYGLTETGRLEVWMSVETAQAQGCFRGTPIIVASDFLRARQSAEIAARALHADSVRIEPGLAERFFGEWERTRNENYRLVWSEDKHDHTHKKKGVQSVAEVVVQLESLMRRLEAEHDGKDIVLVSHGDKLQILEALFKGIHPSLHHGLEPLKTGELRRLS